MFVVQLSRVRAEGESRGGEESVRQLEVDQLRRQLHQLQANAEVCILQAIIGSWFFNQSLYIQV